ncbi:MAG: hypothetical protein HY718_01635, partial [Planctomycetes bacterium]|nr:hypothetical protein [Planctomycetota bacterium]
MDGRERFLIALACGEPDRVPVFEQLYHQALYEHCLGRAPQWYDNLGAVGLAARLRIDATVAVYDGYPAFVPAGTHSRWQSEWGVTYELQACGWPTGYPVDSFPFDEARIRDWTPPELDAARRFRTIAEAAELAHSEGLALVAGLRGPLALVVWHFLGMQDVMIGLTEQPTVIERAVQHYLTFHEPAAEALAEAGADAVFLTEDLGSNTGPLLSVDMYRRFFLGALNAVVGRLRACAVPVILHSDGDVRAFLPDLLQSGISALHPIERRAHMSLSELKRRYGGRLALCGNVDTKEVLSRGTPEQVR